MSSGFCLSFITVSLIAVLVAIINCTGLAYRQGIDRFKLNFILSLDDCVSEFFIASHSIYGSFISHEVVKDLLAIDNTSAWSSDRFHGHLNWNNTFLTILR